MKNGDEYGRRIAIDDATLHLRKLDEGKIRIKVRRGFFNFQPLEV